MTESIMLTAALEYAAAGFRVFPIKPKDKTPLLGGNWKNLATSDERIIRGWWKEHPDANIAIACGHMTKGDKFITVVDMDNKPEKNVNGFQSLYEWQRSNNAPLPKTLSARSGSGGMHYYFFTDKAYKNGRDILDDNSGVDSRSEGGYIIAPPSVHKCGKRYEWESGFDISKIADGGAVLDKLLTEQEVKEAASPPRKQAAQLLKINGDIVDTIAAKLGLDFSEGGRNDAIHKLASSLQSRGYSDSDIFELCARANSERCTPPLPDKEVQTAVQSALKAITKGIPRSVSVVGSIEHYTERLADKFPFIIPHEKKDGSVWYSVSASILADYMLKNDHFVLLDTGGEKPPVLWYENGVYKPLDTNAFKGKIKAHIAEFDKFDDNIHSSRVYDEVYKQIVTSAGRLKSNALNARQDVINFQNGLLDIRSGELIAHTAGVFSTVQIPCEWQSSGAECPLFDAFLNTLTNGDKDTQRLLWEYIGLTISNVHGYKPKKSLFLIGAGNTGKSQFLKLLAMLVGEDNYVSTDLSSIEERFGTFPLWGKRLAGAPDTSFMKIRELKNFKKITGGDPIDFEQKGRDKFTGLYTGCFVFCGNEMPKFSGDRGEHVYDRMAIVQCSNVIPEEKRDPSLIDKLFSERDGIIYKAVAALRRLMKRDCKFELPASCRMALDAYKIDNDEVLQFLEECTVPREQSDSSIFTTTGAMYTAYTNWAKRNGSHYVASRSEFKRTVRELYGDKAEIKDKTHTKRGYPFELTRAAREEIGGVFNYG